MVDWRREGFLLADGLGLETLNCATSLALLLWATLRYFELIMRKWIFSTSYPMASEKMEKL